MKNKECMNCGSTQFHQVENGWKCDYCGTLYLKPKRNIAAKQSNPPLGDQRKRIRTLVAVIVTIIFVMIGSLGYLSSKVHTSYKPIKPTTVTSSEENAFPGKWTQNIFDSVKVATENYDADNEKYSFTGGSSYEDLEKLVGTPDTVTSWEKEDYGMPPRAMATWNKTKDGEYTSHSVTVEYDKKTMMITDKDHH